MIIEGRFLEGEITIQSLKKLLGSTFNCASVSSVPVECLFSTTGIKMNGKRSSLAPYRLNYLSLCLLVKTCISHIVLM
jgi:hypothetical protein